MRNVFKLLGLLGILTLLFAGCGDNPPAAPVKPAPDRLTLLFFYTEN